MPKTKKQPTIKKAEQTTNGQSAPKTNADLIAPNTKFKLTIPWTTVQKEYKESLKHLAEHLEVKGFRKGKAPLNIAEQQLGSQKIYEHTISHVLAPAYNAEVQAKKYRPIIDPNVHPVTMEDGKDWVFEIEIAEIPTVTLGDYRAAVKTAKAKNDLWKPGKEEKKGESDEDAKLRVVFQALLQDSHVKIAELLLREETTKHLSRFLNQLDRLKIPLEEYLKSVGKTSDQLKQDYAMQALTTLQIEFILAEIARVEKVEIPEKEIDAMIAAIPDETMRKNSSTSGQRSLIRSTLMRREVLNKLLAV
jgi:FKBP-type peptidyl-prolyl cis-trans isomerase (trigger factor)